MPRPIPGLSGKTAFVTGASRGIGRAIALRFAADGANVVIAAKTAEPHAKLEGTIHTVAAEVEQAGGRALAIQLDIREEAAVAEAAARAAEEFGGIDILVNNASAIFLAGTLETPVKRYDLMLDVNTRGTFVCSQACLPFLLKAANPHILTLSPPLSTEPRWYGKHLAYTISKYGMTMCTLGLAEEFRARGVAANSLWPRTTIATAAVETFFPQALAHSRRPEIVADAAWSIVTRSSRDVTGRCFIDEEALAEVGVTDLAGYALRPGAPLADDILLP